MSKLQVDLLESKSGIGMTCTPDELFYQRAFAWATVNYDGITLNEYDIDESHNIIAATFEQSGRITFTFENNAINTKYIILGMAGPGNDDGVTTGTCITIQPNMKPDGSSGLTTSSFHIRVLTINSAGSNSTSDRDYVAVAVFGGF